MTYVYVDGFNLYYGALRRGPHRWLDLERLCQLLLARHTIGAIRYFTALVSARTGDPGQPVRQQLYLRALATSPKVSIHVTALANFLSPGFRDRRIVTALKAVKKRYRKRRPFIGRQAKYLAQEMTHTSVHMEKSGTGVCQDLCWHW